ncbi:hypothetical protein LWI29_031208 [Acer saccharum]|uniref:Aminotransferase-like plant mobile domain-containing protein n=1 Tax=Acer saccharum TaxID=4024 RepID=A0AA39WB65_ACESA|nr:hypothetical protein LWI29_031208 [Acer saccharum]
MNVPDLSHPSIYHESKTTVKSSDETDLNIVVISPILEPHGTVRSTKRERIVGVALELYYSKISQLPVASKIDFCEFYEAWAGDREDTVNNNGNQNEESLERERRRIPLSWELVQPILKILGHCLLGPDQAQQKNKQLIRLSRRISNYLMQLLLHAIVCMEEPDDSLKMALLLIANNVLFGQPYDKTVTNWLFNLVDDLDALNSFAWGFYVFKMTMHYIRHGFRSRNTKKGNAKVRYRLYGFPLAIEVMEAVETLFNGFGLRLEHTLPRMRRWTMHKRPRNFVKTISDLEANIRSGKSQVLEVLEAADDEAQKDYMVGVDFDMSVGPQFIPPVEMEIKEKNESLDGVDDGDNGDDGGDGDDGAPTWKAAMKRKAPKKKKKTSGGDRIIELLEAVKALPDEMERIVKREASQLSGVLKALVQEIQPTRGQSNKEEVGISVAKDVAPIVEKEVAGSVLVSGDKRVGYNYAAKEDRSI